MTPREFSLLARRHNREQEASWQRAAMIAHTIYSLHAGERAPRLALADFMPGSSSTTTRSRRSPDDLLAQARALQLAFTTVPERQRTQRPSPRGR